MVRKEITWFDFKEKIPAPYFIIIVQDHEGNFAIGSYLQRDDLFVQAHPVNIGIIIKWARVSFRFSKEGGVECVHQNGEEIKFSDIYDSEDLGIDSEDLGIK